MKALVSWVGERGGKAVVRVNLVGLGTENGLIGS